MYILFEASISEITSLSSIVLDLQSCDNIFSPSFLIRGKIDEIKNLFVFFFIKVMMRKDDGMMKNEVSSPVRFHYQRVETRLGFSREGVIIIHIKISILSEYLLITSSEK